MIVVDPRRTMTVSTAEAAGGPDRVLHLQIEPGSDIALLNAISRIVLQRRWHDVGFLRERVEWQTFEAYQRSSLDVDAPIRGIRGPGRAAHRRLAVAQIRKAANGSPAPKADGSRRRTLLHYEKGLIWGLKNYENVAAARRPGAAHGQRGQARDRLSAAWAATRKAMCDPPYPGGRPALNIDEAIRRGEIKCFWVGGCNPVLTTLRAEAFEGALRERGAPVREALARTARQADRGTGRGHRRGDEERRHVPRGAGHLSHRHDGARPSRAAGGAVGRGEPHLDQRRAPAAALFEVHGPARRGARRLGHHRALRAQDPPALPRRRQPAHGQPVPRFRLAHRGGRVHPCALPVQGRRQRRHGRLRRRHLRHAAQARQQRDPDPGAHRAGHARGHGAHARGRPLRHADRKGAVHSGAASVARLRAESGAATQELPVLGQQRPLEPDLADLLPSPLHPLLPGPLSHSLPRDASRTMRADWESPRATWSRCATTWDPCAPWRT